MNPILHFERSLHGNQKSLFKLLFWAVIHTISIVLASVLVLSLKITNLWLVIVLFGLIISVIAKFVNQYIFDFYYGFDWNFLYYVLVHGIAIFLMNVLFVPLSGISTVTFKFLLSGFGVAFIARLAKRDLMKKIMLAFSVLLVLGNIPLSSELGQLADLATFGLTSYIILMGAWLALKYVNSLDLHSDLTLWGLRAIGGLVLLFGFVMLSSSFMSSFIGVYSHQNFGLSGNLPWMLGAAIIVVGLFMVFRSNRRYTIIGFW